MTNSDPKQWKLTAITEALGDLELSIDDKLTVGRGQDNDVVLGSKQVSRQHAELNVVGDQLMVQDLGSSNGTLVNDQKLEPHQATALAAEDTLTFAAFSFRVSQVAATSTITPTPIADEPEVVETAEPKDKSLAQSNAEAEQAKKNADAIERSGIEDLTEAELEEKLEDELEGPIAMGDPNQQSHTNSKEEHFNELAAEADPEVHKSKQAAAAQMSATTTQHEEVAEETPIKPEAKAIEPKEAEPKVIEPETKAVEPETKAVEPKAAEPKVIEPEAKVVEPKAVEPEPKAEKVTPVSTQAPVKEESLEKSRPAPESKDSFNTVKENPQHNVAHVTSSAPTPNASNAGKKSSFLWWALILVGLAVALWLYNSGTLA